MVRTAQAQGPERDSLACMAGAQDRVWKVDESSHCSSLPNSADIRGGAVLVAGGAKSAGVAESVAWLRGQGKATATPPRKKG